MRTSWRGCLAALVVCVAVTPVNADVLGLPSSSGWTGHGSRALRLPDGVPPELLVDSPGSTPLYFSRTTDDPPAEVDAQATTSPYEMHGAIEASGYADTYRVGGFFRDELFVESANGDPVEIELVFGVTGTWDVLGPDPFGLLRVLWMSPAGGGTFLPIAWGDAVNLDGTSAASDVFDLDLTLSSAQYGNVVASGTYLPTTVTLYGDVRNASIDWSHTLVLNAVNVLQGGRVLGADEYTIFSTNGTAAFAPFERRLPTQVPEPAVLLLVGVALIGVASRVRRVRHW